MIDQICDEAPDNFANSYEEAIEKRTRMRYARLRLGLEQHRCGCTSPSPIRSHILKIVPIGWLGHSRMQPGPKVVLGL